MRIKTLVKCGLKITVSKSRAQIMDFYVTSAMDVVHPKYTS